MKKYSFVNPKHVYMALAAASALIFSAASAQAVWQHEGSPERDVPISYGSGAGAVDMERNSTSPKLNSNQSSFKPTIVVEGGSPATGGSSTGSSGDTAGPPLESHGNITSAYLESPNEVHYYDKGASKWKKTTLANWSSKVEYKAYKVSVGVGAAGGDGSGVRLIAPGNRQNNLAINNAEAEALGFEEWPGHFHAMSEYYGYSGPSCYIHDEKRYHEQGNAPGTFKPGLKFKTSLRRCDGNSQSPGWAFNIFGLSFEDEYGFTYGANENGTENLACVYTKTTLWPRVTSSWGVTFNPGKEKAATFTGIDCKEGYPGQRVRYQVQYERYPFEKQPMGGHIAIKGLLIPYSSKRGISLFFLESDTYTNAKTVEDVRGHKIYKDFDYTSSRNYTWTYLHKANPGGVDYSQLNAKENHSYPIFIDPFAYSTPNRFENREDGIFAEIVKVGSKRNLYVFDEGDLEFKAWDALSRPSSIVVEMYGSIKIKAGQTL